MNREEFLAQLERLLYDISDQERTEALDYYNNYFEDAGEENESKVIQELGSPGKVAAIIKAELQGSTERFGEYTETGYQDERFKENGQMPDKRNTSREEQAERRDVTVRSKKNRSASSWALIIILLVFTSPLWLGIGGGLFGLLVGILGAIFGFIVAFSVGGLALVVGGFAMAVTGIVKMFTATGLGLIVFGGGLLMFVVGILFVIAFLWVAFKLLPKILRGVVDTIHRLISKGRGGDRS